MVRFKLPGVPSKSKEKDLVLILEGIIMGERRDPQQLRQMMLALLRCRLLGPWLLSNLFVQICSVLSFERSGDDDGHARSLVASAK
jgi:hypothetical protein